MNLVNGNEETDSMEYAIHQRESDRAIDRLQSSKRRRTLSNQEQQSQGKISQQRVIIWLIYCYFLLYMIKNVTLIFVVIYLKAYLNLSKY